jgi:iron complex transport system permease protein
MPPPSTATAAGRRRAASVIGLLVGGCLAAIVLALLVGSVPIDAGRLLAAVLGERTDATATIVLDLRLPRALAAFAAGGLLALAGTLMQVLMRNPLADPYVLGISGGAAVAALTAILVGLSTWSGMAALVGALVSTLLVFGLARGRDAGIPWVATRLLLTGVVVAAGWGALIALLLTLAPDAAVRGMLFWLLGDLSAASGGAPAIAALAVALAAALLVARDLNAITRGEDTAMALGVAVPQVALVAHVLAATATAVAVALAGSIGFVGLLAPHAMRLIVGNDQRVLLPAATLAGGMLLVVADTLARTLVAPLQLPVGVLTALVGVPAFLFLLARGGAR